MKYTLENVFQNRIFEINSLKGIMLYTFWNVFSRMIFPKYILKKLSEMMINYIRYVDI